MNWQVQPSSNASVVPGAGIGAIDIWGSLVLIDGSFLQYSRETGEPRAVPSIIDDDQFTPASQFDFILPDRATCPAMTRWFGADRDRFTNVRRSSPSEDVVVLGGLVGVFSFTYINLPLIYYHV
jgi:hypothetical protein